MSICLANTDQLEITLYNLVGRYHGVYEEIAEKTGYKAATLRQATNPDYHERPSFITRTVRVLIALIKLHPRTGLLALQALVTCIMTAAPDEATREKIKSIERHIATVRQEIEGVNTAIESLPVIRLTAREMVERRKVKRLKQPSLSKRSRGINI